MNTAVEKGNGKPVEPRQHATDTEQAQEIAAKKGLVKGIASVSETGSKYEQGANAAELC
jgi:hypothetical protein